jgi:hypothetical protein
MRLRKRRFTTLHAAAWAALAMLLLAAEAPAAQRAPAPALTTVQPAASGSACSGAAGHVLSVGPRAEYALPSQAAAVARPGDVVKIAAGDYHGDVATWSADGLTICAAGGRVRLFADGNSAEGKAIWVIGGARVTIDGIDYIGAKVPDANGAGIRAQGGELTVLNSGFYDNENGILGGDGATLTIDRCEFARGGAGDGQSHNIYIGFANRLTVSASYFHEAKAGHNLKSRARETHIENSYFIDGPRGSSSYLADFPSGGAVTLRGNLFHKGPEAENSTAISFGAEGMKWQVNTLEMLHNTVVMTRGGGHFLAARPATQSVALSFNLFAGTDNPGLLTGGVAADKVQQTHNVITVAEMLPGADNVASPRFWPSAGLLPRITLPPGSSDPGYLSDAPRPFVLRPIKPGARLAGAIQSKP